MHLSNDARKAFIRAVVSMRGHGIFRLAFTCYWNDDEGHTLEEIEIFYIDQPFRGVRWSMGDIDGLRELTWNLDEYGVFEINSKIGTMTQIGEAWIPEPELQTKMYEEPIELFQLDEVNPLLPMVEYINTGPFDDSLAALWNELSQVPVKKNPSSVVVIDAPFMTWAQGVAVANIVRWFREADSKRFNVKFN